MDTSKTYIKMCDCEEIQKLWSVELKQHGDFWWCEVLSNTNGRGLNMKISKDRCITKYVWLPCQDQLQKMVSDDLYMLLHSFNEFIDFHTDGSGKYKTMEQLWLAFVMKEKYNKVWNGEEWTKGD